MHYKSIYSSIDTKPKDKNIEQDVVLCLSRGFMSLPDWRCSSVNVYQSINFTILEHCKCNLIKIN